MRRIFSLMIVAAVLAIFLDTMSCQKAKFPPAPASFNVINAIATGNPIVPKLGSDTVGKYYKNGLEGNRMLQISYGSSQLYSPVPGSIPFLVVPITDTSFKIFNGNLKLESGGVYSFFLSGDTTHADTLLVKDNIPYYTDSSAGVRFVNLSIGGKAITINLAGDSGNLQFPVLGYQGITDFKKYSAAASVGGFYTFEIRDQASGDLLYTYYWIYTMSANNTIVIAGSPDPASATPLNVFAVNNY